LVRGPSPSRRAARHHADPRRSRRPLIVEGLECRLCLSHTYLLVTDGPPHNQIFRFDGSTGALIDILVYRNNTQLNDPDLGLISDGAGNVYADGYDSANVARFLIRDGSPNPAPGQSNADFVPPSSGGLNGVEGLAFGADGNFYVSNQVDKTPLSGQGNVLEYSGTDGSFINQVVPTGDSGLSQANDLHFGPDGHLYVDSFDTGQLLRYDENTFAELPSPGRTGANFIDADTSHYVNGFGWGPDGNLYVSKIDYHYTNGFVDEYDGVTGDFLGTFISPDPTAIGTIDGIVWEGGNLYLTNRTGAPQKTGVLEYDASGNFLGVFASDPNLSNPTGLVFCDPGMAARASLHLGDNQQQVGQQEVAVLFASSFKQSIVGSPFVTTSEPANGRSASITSVPQRVQESPTGPLDSIIQGNENSVARPSSRDSGFAGFESATSLGGGWRVSELDLLAGR
jgi:hypothetical protein